MNPAIIADYHAEPYYSMQRGVATHYLLNQILSRPKWPRFLTDSSNRLVNQVERCLGEYPLHKLVEENQDFVPNPRHTTLADFSLEYPGTLEWMAFGVRQLLEKLVRDLKVSQLQSEVRLPHYDLPDGRVLNCGEPDMQMISAAYRGSLQVEVKTGFKRVRPSHLKAARYLAAGTDEALRLGQLPLEGLLWVSLASTLQDQHSGQYQPFDAPVLTLDFIPMNRDWIDRRLHAAYGVRIEDLADRRISNWH